MTVAEPVASTLTLREIAESLVAQALVDHPAERVVTLLAISMANLVEEPAVQLELAVNGDDPHRLGSPSGAARLAVDRSMDMVRKRFGRSAVGYAAAALSERGAVPDEFRERAEHEWDPPGWSGTFPHTGVDSGDAARVAPAVQRRRPRRVKTRVWWGPRSTYRVFEWHTLSTSESRPAPARSTSVTIRIPRVATGEVRVADAYPQAEAPAAAASGHHG